MRRFLRPTLLLAMLSLLTACATHSPKPVDVKPKQAIQYYVIDVDRGLKEHNRSEGRTLYIAPIRVTSQFRSKALVFRVGENTFESQSNHTFFDTPEEMITTQLQRWLIKTGLFDQVVTRDTNSADYLLEAAVTGLYGDKIEDKPSQSIVEMQFFLTDLHADKEEVVFQTGLHINTHIKKTTPSEVVRGWKISLEKVFSTLEDDLSNYFVTDPPQ